MDNGISVIITTFNSERFIREAIESVINQKFNGEKQIIISDDGSTDATLEIASEYKSFITIIERPEDSKKNGASLARNRGLQIANKTYLCFLDSDDIQLPSFISHMTETLDKNSDIDYVFCRSKKKVYSQGDNDVLVSGWTREKMNGIDQKYHVLNRAYCINTNTIVFRRKIFNKIGLFNENLSNGNDTDMWLRVSEVYKGQFVDFYGCIYRIGHSENQITAAKENVKFNCSCIIYTEALRRYITSRNKDTFRLFLITRNMLYLICSKKTTTSARIKRNLFVYTKLLCLFPLELLYFFYRSNF